jgi:hypothetical protein
MRVRYARLVVLLAAVALTPPLPAAEEAWREDGRRVAGTLVLQDGRLHFRPAEGEPVPLADLTRVRFAGAAPPPFRAGDGRRVVLRDGQRITGQIIELNEDTLALRVAWAPRVELPRAAVASVGPLPGWRTVAADDFRDGLKGFTAAGEPALAEAAADTGARAVLLRADGQSLVYTPAKPPAAGRVGVNFEERGQPARARWTFGLRFRAGERSRHVVVTVAGEGEDYVVEGGGPKDAGRGARRTPGWHRLVVQFGPRSLRVTCDDDVLAYDLERGPGGCLQQVTIRCQQTADGGEVRGGVAWTEFCLERAVREYPGPPADPEQDEVRLADVDQLFGRILGADRRAIRIEGRFGKRSLPWTGVAGCSFRRPAAPVKTNGGPEVRIALHSGLDAEADRLDGVVTALDGRRLVLRHALLGEVTLERGRVRELRPIAGGPK